MEKPHTWWRELEIHIAIPGDDNSFSYKIA